MQLPLTRTLRAALLIVASVCMSSTGVAADRPQAATCLEALPEWCPAPEPPDPAVSFNSSTMREFRRAQTPPWRRAPGTGPRLATLHDLATQGRRPALPRWRRDAAAEANPNPFRFVTTDRSYAARLYPIHVPNAEHWSRVQEAAQVGEACPCPLTQADGPGRIPDGGRIPGTPLTIDKRPGFDLLLDWGSSCSTLAEDYAVFEGRIGVWYGHQARLCSTSGGTSVSLSPDVGGRYYLVVPLNERAEGGYGIDSNGNDRPLGAPNCRPAVLQQSCP